MDMIDVESRMMEFRGQAVLLDRDVATIYGVETREVNQAVRNNPTRFPEGYVFVANKEESTILRSKILTLKENNGRGKHSKHGYKVFTERGLYMLATILKGERAAMATIAIIETYARLREMARTMEKLQTVKDGGDEQRSLLRRTGEMLANIIGDNLSTKTTETEIEFNFAVVKIRHKIIHHTAI